MMYVYKAREAFPTPVYKSIVPDVESALGAVVSAECRRLASCAARWSASASESYHVLMPLSFTRTLKLKVRTESYGWLNAAAIEVNQVFNYVNEASWLAATRTDLKRKWLTGFDLCNLTSGAARYFERIGADTIQRVC